jgi:hypothetical protein
MLVEVLHMSGSPANAILLARKRACICLDHSHPARKKGFAVNAHGGSNLIVHREIERNALKIDLTFS